MRVLALLLTGALIATACTSDPQPQNADGTSTTSDSTGSEPDGASTDEAEPADSEPSSDNAITRTFAAPDPDPTPLEISNDIRIGVLDNGLTYYVQSNDSPGNSVSMRLAVGSGALDENPIGTGAAHFLEHMMFNGTEKYPGNTLDAALRGIGAEIGPDFNAFTNSTETVYRIQVADENNNVDVAFDVLAQWASAATITEQAVQDEAFVVREELRVRDETGEGLIGVEFELAYQQGTPHEGVNVSGTADTVNALTHVELREFYDTWYRPDNMAVIAVGDRSLDDLEDEIIERFSDMTARGESPESIDSPNFELRNEPFVKTVVEPSFGSSYISVDIPVQTWDPSTRGGAELQLIESTLGLMINNRLNEGVESGRIDLLRAGGGYFQWNRDLAFMGFNVDAADFEAGTEELMTELRASVVNPFTQSELDRAADAMRASQDQRLARFDSTQDRDFANQLVNHFLEGGDLESIEDSHDRAIDTLDSLDLDAVNEHYGWMMTSSEPIVLVVGPDEDRVGEVENHLAAIERASVASIEAFDDDVDEIDELLAETPPTVEEIERQDLDANDGFELIFDNGIRVLFSPSTISANSVSFVSESPGGRSVLSVDDGAVAPAAIAAVSTSGVGPWDPVQVRRYLSDRDVSISPYIADFTEGFSGSAATSDLETLFELVHLSVVEPRVDPVPFRQQLEFARDSLDRVGLDSGAASAVALADARTGGGALAASPTAEQLDEFTEADALRIYDDRFSTLDEHVVVIVGDAEEDTIVDLARTYLGSLPAVSATDDPERPELPGEVSERLSVGSGTSGGSYRLLYLGELANNSVSTQVVAEVAQRILNDRLFTVIREELGATYGGNARIDFSEPEDGLELLVSIDGDPSRIDEIADTVRAELDLLREGSISNADFDEAVAVVDAEYGFINNGFIIQSLFDEAYLPADDVINRTSQRQALDEITRSDVSDFIFSLTETDSIVDVRNVP